MENLVFTQLSVTEVRQLFREELQTFLGHLKIPQSSDEKNDEIGGVGLAMKLTGLAKPTIYGLVSNRKIPHSKRGKRLYFSRKELIDWISDGKRKTQVEIATESDGYLQKRER